METVGAKEKSSDEVGEGESTGDVTRETIYFIILHENRRLLLKPEKLLQFPASFLFYMKMSNRQGSQSTSDRILQRNRE